MNEPNTEKKPIGAELILPVAGLIFTLYYFSTVWDSAWEAQVNAFFVGSILIGLILIFCIKVSFSLLRGECSLSILPLIEPKRFIPKRVILFALTMAYIIFLEWGGFTISSFLFLFLATFLLNDGRRRGLILLVSSLMALGGYLLFIVAFETRFPMGPFENFIKQVF